VWSDFFQPIYSLQDSGEFFATPEQLLQRTGLWNFTQQRCRDFMSETLKPWWLSWGREHFMEDLAGAINRCNYNQQSTTMNALAGLVSYLPAAGSGGVWQVMGGNSLLAARMLHAAMCTTHLNTTVSNISYNSTSGFYSLTFADGRGTSNFHDVILAVPMEIAKGKLQLHGLPPVSVSVTCTNSLCLRAERTEAEPPLRQYQRTVSTFVADGELQPSAFGVNTMPANTIFVTEDADSDFSSISERWIRVKRDQTVERLYKVFSTAALSIERIKQLFGSNAKIIQYREWMAYPRQAAFVVRFAVLELFGTSSLVLMPLRSGKPAQPR
jgi:hypothetical protein